jgi:dTDP-4-dehydrorhamnose reductase
MRVAIVGANGQLGTDVYTEFESGGHNAVGLTHEQIEITDPASVRDVLGGASPDLVINTAAMHHVDRCESRAREAYAVNAVGARNLALFSQDSDVPLMHVSTDYVFDGKKRSPYLETDLPGPINVYGNTKLAGEHFVACTAERSFVLRVSGLYGVNVCRAKGPNFVERMLGLAASRDEVRVVDDEVLTPTSTREVARQMVRLAEADCYGVIHATAGGGCSWFEFTREAFRLAGVTTRLEVARPDEFPAKAPRPAYCVLENARLEEAGLNRMKPWNEALAEYMRCRTG